MRAKSELRPYQQRIATHLYENDEALCVVRPGGGKTVAALTAINELMRDKVIRHALVIAPKRVASVVWPDEMWGWEHTKGMADRVLDGDPKERLRKLQYHPPKGYTGYTLTMIGLDLVGWLIEQIESWPEDHPIFDLLVIDEISKLRDSTGVRSKLLAKHAQRWKMIWGLSGTLRPNSALDLFMPVRIVTRGKLWGRSFYQWRQTRFRPIDFKGYNWTPLQGTEDQLNAEIAPLTVTLREDEAPQLPALSIIIDRITLPDKAKLTYRDMHRKLLARLGKNKVLAANKAVATGKLAQIANGFLYAVDEDEGEGPRGPITATAIHDEKRAWLEDLIEQATGPTLLVYEFLNDLRMIVDVLGHAVPHLGDGVSDRDAARYIAAWNAGKLRFMALHPASGGHGLNLQDGGCDMAWISPTWSPEMWEQTIARLHRSGQTKPVMVRVCVASDTVDDLKLDRVHHKMDAQKAFEKYLASYAEQA